MMRCSFSRLEVGRSSSMLLPCAVDSPSCSLLVTWARGTGTTRAGEVRRRDSVPQGFYTLHRPFPEQAGELGPHHWPLRLSLPLPHPLT
jgi:hypothetical protein